MIYTVADFLSDLEVAFPRYPNKDVVAERRWVDLVKKKLGSFKGPVLKDAAAQIISSRKAKGFPALAELIEACENSDRFLNPAPVKLVTTQPGDSIAAYMRAQARWAEALNNPAWRSTIRRAAEQDWHMQLKEFIGEFKRLPDERESDRLKAEADQTVEKFQECLRGGFENAASLSKLGQSMLDKRAEERKTILRRLDERLRI